MPKRLLACARSTPTLSAHMVANPNDTLDITLIDFFMFFGSVLCMESSFIEQEILACSLPLSKISWSGPNCGRTHRQQSVFHLNSLTFISRSNGPRKSEAQPEFARA